ncbi:hypothetical protein MNV49_001815 [Pseudohyphozyma bogoriensis]|nr:hypothetical protein MNV49_001815 [Pseudohyphozyma bogoriensis]
MSSITIPQNRKVFERGSPEFNKLLPEGDARLLPGTRAIIWLDVHAVGSSCGMSVPYFTYEGDRPALKEWAAEREDADAEGKVKHGLQAYWANKNSESIDGLPALKCGIQNLEKGLNTLNEAGRANLRIQKLHPSQIGVKTTARQKLNEAFFLGLGIGVLVTANAKDIAAPSTRPSRALL